MAHGVDRVDGRAGHKGRLHAAVANHGSPQILQRLIPPPGERLLQRQIKAAVDADHDAAAGLLDQIDDLLCFGQIHPRRFFHQQRDAGANDLAGDRQGRLQRSNGDTAVRLFLLQHLPQIGVHAGETEFRCRFPCLLFAQIAQADQLYFIRMQFDIAGGGGQVVDLTVAAHTQLGDLYFFHFTSMSDFRSRFAMCIFGNEFSTSASSSCR